MKSSKNCARTNKVYGDFYNTRQLYLKSEFTQQQQMKHALIMESYNFGESNGEISCFRLSFYFVNLYNFNYIINNVRTETVTVLLAIIYMRL